MAARVEARPVGAVPRRAAGLGAGLRLTPAGRRATRSCGSRARDEWLGATALHGPARESDDRAKIRGAGLGEARRGAGPRGAEPDGPSEVAGEHPPQVGHGQPTGSGRYGRRPEPLAPRFRSRSVTGHYSRRTHNTRWRGGKRGELHRAGSRSGMGEQMGVGKGEGG
jgi:hypothetical protein